ncbi:MAG: ExbD/TolR family protein [Gammaproteobacteria bacterium]|nr:MAG: ExbD/TolR family protein [Gammaproteobacteria bacterium]
MFVPKKRRYLTEINVIPYVDVMLVLLVIFMVTAPFMIQGIDINLPEVNSQPIDKANLENITISINAEGKFYLDLDSLKGKAFLISELKQEIQKILKNNNSLEIYIRADKNVMFGEVAKLMSLLQDLKPDAINFITEPIDDK